MRTQPMISKSTSTPSEVIEYAPVEPVSFEPDNQISIAIFRKNIVLQAQGGTMFLDEMMPAAAAVAFATLYDVAVELALRLKDKSMILLFSHRDDPVIRPEEINLSIWTELSELKTKAIQVRDIALPPPMITLNLGDAWSVTSKDDDLIARTSAFIKILVSKLRPSLTLQLAGDIPVLPLLSAIYLARPYAEMIRFQSEDGSIVNLF